MTNHTSNKNHPLISSIHHKSNGVKIHITFYIRRIAQRFCINKKLNYIMKILKHNYSIIHAIPNLSLYSPHYAEACNALTVPIFATGNTGKLFETLCKILSRLTFSIKRDKCERTSRQVSLLCPWARRLTAFLYL